MQNNWKPIETAPMDGTIILGVWESENYYFPTAVYFGHYHPNSRGNLCWRDASGRNKIRVSHWQPLPIAPSGKPAKYCNSAGKHIMSEE
jgi:hypothetical protein